MYLILIRMPFSIVYMRAFLCVSHVDCYFSQMNFLDLKSYTTSLEADNKDDDSLKKRGVCVCHALKDLFRQDFNLHLPCVRQSQHPPIRGKLLLFYNIPPSRTQDLSGQQEQSSHQTNRSDMISYFAIDSFMSFVLIRSGCYSTYSQLLKRAYLPTLMNRRLQDICILMYKEKHKLCPTYICNIFKNQNSSYFLRQSDFSISSYNTVTYGKHSLRYLGPRLWATLFPDVRHAKTLDAFKNKIRGCDVSLLVDDDCKGCSLCSS